MTDKDLSALSDRQLLLDVAQRIARIEQRMDDSMATRGFVHEMIADKVAEALDDHAAHCDVGELKVAAKRRSAFWPRSAQAWVVLISVALGIIALLWNFSMTLAEDRFARGIKTAVTEEVRQALAAERQQCLTQEAPNASR